VSETGYETFLPHRDNPPKTADKVHEIFRNNVAAIDRCGLVVANLNGITTDDGTAWEIGYAAAREKRLVGVYTDWRRRFDDEIVNLMIDCSMDRIVRSLDELADVLG
jgi:nucleoside 2-deoxyribosyltransferase